MNSPVENFCDILQHEHMQYFICELHLYGFTLHTVESRQYCCQQDLYSCKWKLLPTKYRCAVFHLGLLYAVYCLW